MDIGRCSCNIVQAKSVDGLHGASLYGLRSLHQSFKICNVEALIFIGSDRLLFHSSKQTPHKDGKAKHRHKDGKSKHRTKLVNTNTAPRRDKQKMKHKKKLKQAKIYALPLTKDVFFSFLVLHYISLLSCLLS